LKAVGPAARSVMKLQRFGGPNAPSFVDWWEHRDISWKDGRPNYSTYYDATCESLSSACRNARKNAHI